MKSNRLKEAMSRLSRTIWLKRKHIIYGSIIVILLLVGSIRLSDSSPYTLHSDSVQYFRAEVLSVQETQTYLGNTQNIKVKILDGPDRGSVTLVSRGANFGDASYNRIPVGSKVLLTKDSGNGNQYSFGDRWRIQGIAVLFLLLLILI